MIDTQKIYFSLPDFIGKGPLNLNFIETFNNQREKFRDNVVIDSIYGSFNCIWTGGRSGEYSAYVYDYDMIVTILKTFNQYGVSIRYAFNNVLVTEQHISDTVGNKLLQLLEEANNTYEGIHNGCTVATQALFNHITKNYPSLEVLWSTNLENSNVDFINQLSKDNMMVLPLKMNNTSALKEIKYPSNIEILCREEGCPSNCPWRQEHQLVTSNFFLKEAHPANTPFIASHGNCINPNHSLYFYPPFQQDNTAYVTYQDIIEKYLPLGINKFKIAGRSGGKGPLINVIESYVVYFAKPEYQNEIRNILLVNNIS